MHAVRSALEQKIMNLVTTVPSWSWQELSSALNPPAPPPLTGDQREAIWHLIGQGDLVFGLDRRLWNPREIPPRLDPRCFIILDRIRCTRSVEEPHG